MRTIIFKVITICLINILCSSAFAANYKLDPTHSFVEFRIQHLGYSWLYGRFNDIEGQFNYDADKPANSSITLQIKTDSIDSNHAERDKHLRDKDFLNVKKYPVAKFKSTNFDAKKGILKGDLTLHGITKSIDINVKKVGEGKDPWGGYRTGFIGTIKLRRADFGISYDLGPAAEFVELELGIEGIRQ